MRRGRVEVYSVLAIGLLIPIAVIAFTLATRGPEILPRQLVRLVNRELALEGTNADAIIREPITVGD